MKVEFFKNYDNLVRNVLEEVEVGSTLLTFSSRAARRFIFFFRKYKLQKKDRVWISPDIYSFNFFVDLLFDDLVTDKRVMSFEDSLLLWYRAVKENYQEENLNLIDLALEYKRHFEFADKEKISLYENESDFFQKRNSVLESFKKFKDEEKFLSYSEEMAEIIKAIEQKEISLPKRIIILDKDDYSKAEREFVDYLSNKTEIVAFEINCSKDISDSEISLYEEPKSEIESAVNKAIELWENGEKSTAIAFFDDSYKKEIVRVLSDFQNSFDDSFRYNIEDCAAVSDFTSFELIKKILTLSEGIPGETLFDIVSLPFFKPKVSLSQNRSNALLKGLKLHNEQAFKNFCEVFRFGDELNIFLENSKVKISDLSKNLKKIIEDHFEISGNSPLSQSFREILDCLESFEAKIPEEEMTPSEFERIFTASLQNKSVENDGSELCGIQVLSYTNCPYQNFDNLFLVGANLSVLPELIPIYPYFSADEKKNCCELDIIEHFKKEERFLKKVLETNKNVYISRAKKDKDKPFISSPLLIGREVEKRWNKYDFSLNLFLISETFHRTATQRKDGKFKESEPLSLPLPDTLKVTKEALDIFKCPFLFFARTHIGVEEPEVIEPFVDSKEFGSILHALISKIGEKIKDISDQQNINIGDFTQIANSFLEENGKDLNDIQKASLKAFLFGKEGRKGFLEKFLEFEKKRIQEGSKIEGMEVELSKSIAKWENLNIKGRIDRIEKNSNGQRIRILDFKAKKGNIKASDRFQLCCYKALIEEDLSDQPQIESMLITLLDLKTNTVKEAEKNFERFVKSLQNVKNNNFEPDPYSNPCQYCNFDLICHIETKEVNQNGEDQESVENE